MQTVKPTAGKKARTVAASARIDDVLTTRPTRPNARGAARRIAILQTAHQVFLERGYAGATVEEVISRVGGSKASLYSYFGSKEGLFDAMIQARCAAFLREVAVPVAVEGDLETTLKAFGLRFFAFFTQPERLGVTRAIIAEATRFPELAQRLYDAGPRPIRVALAEFFTRCHQQGLLHCPDSELSAVLFMELIKGHSQFRGLLGMTPIFADRSPEQFVGAAVQLFLRGHTQPDG